jgi:hypothetical protein
MMFAPRGVGLILLVLGLGFLAGSGSPAQAPGSEPLPESQAKTLLKRFIEMAEEGLKDAQSPKTKKDEKKEHVRKARGAAVLIAICAQDSMTPANAGERASLRDAALKLATLIKDSKFKEAQKQLDEIKGGPKMNPKADPKPVKILPKYADMAEVMKLYSTKPGGAQVEAKMILNNLTKKVEKAKELPASIFTDEWVGMLYMTLLVGDLSKEHVPEKVGGKGVREWQQFNTDMIKETRELIKLAKDKDTKGAYKALVRLDGTCSGCHKIFRLEN